MGWVAGQVGDEGGVFDCALTPVLLIKLGWAWGVLGLGDGVDW
jgi:hypothetical protein